MTLSGKIALVTGGSRGIGRAIAIELAQKGARVVINYAHREEEALLTANLIREAGGQDSLIKRFDVSNSAEVDAAMDAIKQQVGEIDILVNNAGIAKDGLLLRYKNEDWRQVLGANLDGAFYCARVCVRGMIKKHWGRIINISSVVGEMGNPGQVAYCSAKAGLLGLTKSLARELASRQITVNAVTPGYIETDMTAAINEKAKEALVNQIPLGFAGTGYDIAHAVSFLASDDARYITGHVLAVNGGMYM